MLSSSARRVAAQSAAAVHGGVWVNRVDWPVIQPSIYLELSSQSATLLSPKHTDGACRHAHCHTALRSALSCIDATNAGRRVRRFLSSGRPPPPPTRLVSGQSLILCPSQILRALSLPSNPFQQLRPILASNKEGHILPRTHECDVQRPKSCLASWLRHDRCPETR